MTENEAEEKGEVCSYPVGREYTPGEILERASSRIEEKLKKLHHHKMEMISCRKWIMTDVDRLEGHGLMPQHLRKKISFYLGL